MSWKDVEALAPKEAIQPIGSLEQHGPHLPLLTDSIIASSIAERVSEEVGIACLPVIHLGFSLEHMGFQGTISLRAETLISIVKDIASSLKSHGLRRLYLINAHGGNRAPLELVIQQLRDELGLYAYLFNVAELARQSYSKAKGVKDVRLGHGDELETSIMLAIEPSLVRMDRLKPEESRFDEQALIDTVDFVYPWRSQEISSQGIIGDPALASADKGRLIMNEVVRKIANLIAKVCK